MVPVQLLMLEDEVGDDGKHHEGDALLDDFQLYEVEGTSVVYKAKAVGGYLTAVFEEGNHPREGNDQIKRPVGGDARLLKAQVAIPCESHEDIAQNEQQHCINTIYHNYHYQKTGANVQISEHKCE